MKMITQYSKWTIKRDIPRAVRTQSDAKENRAQMQRLSGRKTKRAKCHRILQSRMPMQPTPEDRRDNGFLIGKAKGLKDATTHTNHH